MRHTSQSLFFSFLISALFFSTPALSNEVAVSLRGSPTSMARQNNVATELGYDFVQTSDQLYSMVESGELVILPGNGHYDVLGSVSYPYGRPEVRLFIERLAAQYHQATGEKLVVTSLLRPVAEQPRNSHELSVHPAGIAIDLRISSRRASQQWLESVLLKLERQGLLDVTRERWPPHYHVALFPQAYKAHVERLVGTEAVELALVYEDEEQAEEPVQVAESTAPEPEKTAAAAVGPIDKDGFDATRLAVLAGVLLAGMFFGLGYWRGLASERDRTAPERTLWPGFTVSSTHAPVDGSAPHDMRGSTSGTSGSASAEGSPSGTSGSGFGRG